MSDDPHGWTLPGGEDPVAARVRWEPLVRGGASFRTRNLVTVSPDRLEFPASVGMKLFGGAFVAAGLLAIWLTVSAGAWLPMLIGLLFAGVGIWLVRGGTAPVVFDRRHGAFWKGRLPPYEARNTADIKDYATLDRIHALQIVSEHVRGNKTSYTSYELNVVLADGERINVVDHGDYKALRAHATTLAAFLDRPLWDAVAGHH